MSQVLLITADDFGLTEGVTRAVVRAHRDGVVTSASILAVGRAYATAVDLSSQNPGLSVGVHLAAVGEDPPLRPATEVPTLVDRHGRFPLSYRGFLRRAALGRVDMAHLRREFETQIERVLGDGIVVTHLDTHQHLHLWPAVGRIVVELAAKYDIPAVRLPRSHRASPLATAVRRLEHRLSAQLDRADLLTTADFAGLDEAGAMDRELDGALDKLAHRAATTAELNVHPGEAGDGDLARFAWGYRWDRELKVLVDPATRATVERRGFTLTSWGALAAWPR